MSPLSDHVNLLNAICGLSTDLLDSLHAFVDDLKHLAHEYEENQKGIKQASDLGFNAFAMVSDVYHRENFHSDVIAAILDPDGAHGQRNQHLHLFLKFLRDHHEVPLSLKDYENAQVKREPGRIDLLISDKKSKKTIIVENKINGAGDMNRQVVRYLETVEDKWGQKCDAIIYLCLDQIKTPQTHGWTDSERMRVKPLLRSVIAYENEPKDLCQGWLTACAETTPDSEVSHVIRQYQQLILKLGQNAMNKPLMQKYYELMENETRYNAALSLVAMMKDLHAYRAQRLYEEYLPKRQPFLHSYLYKSEYTIFEGLPITEGSRIKIDIETWPDDHTKLCLWDNADMEQGILPKRILKEIGLLDKFSNPGGNGRWYYSDFQFPKGEAALRAFMDDFLQRLQNYVESAK